MTSPRSTVTRLTHNGVEHKIFNGIPDWVYQGCNNITRLSQLINMRYFFESVYTLNVKIVCKISGGTNTEQEIVFSWLNAMYTCKFKLLVIIINGCCYTTRQFFFQLVLQFCYGIPSVTSLDMIKSCFCFRKCCPKENQFVLFAKNTVM